MGYPPEHKQQTHARIVESARRLWKEKGYANVSIGQIMKAAGLTHGGFYAHFKSKDELFVEAALGIGSTVDFTNGERAPLLLLAAGNSHTVRANVVAALYRRHRGSSAITSFKQFPGYSHWLIAEPGWERIADYSIEWVQNQVGRF